MTDGSARLPTLLTESDAAAYLGLKPDTLARIRRRGDIGHVLVGRRVRYTEQHILDYLNQQTKPCRPPAPEKPRNPHTRPDPKPWKPDSAYGLAMAKETFARRKKP